MGGIEVKPGIDILFHDCFIKELALVEVAGTIAIIFIADYSDCCFWLVTQKADNFNVMQKTTI